MLFCAFHYSPFIKHSGWNCKAAFLIRLHLFQDSTSYKGIDVEIDKVAEINYWTLEKPPQALMQRSRSLQAGQADAIMAGMTKTKERGKFMMSGYLLWYKSRLDQEKQ